MKLPFINQEFWKKAFKGWLIIACALRNKNMLYLCAKKDIPNRGSDVWDSQVPTLFMVINLSKPESPHGGKEISNISWPSLSVSRKPLEQGLLSSSDDNGYVNVMGSGKWPIEYIDEGKYPGTKLKCVLDYTYAVGVRRKIYKRVDIGKWVKLDKGIVIDKSIKRDGFDDIDAFTEQDMYAVGGLGDVWHYDGDSWSQCEFPSKEKLNTVVCAPDANVYIGGKAGNIWKGRENNWEKVYSGNYTIL